ncbi:MAG: hypothetical protein ACC700_16285 [Anaerolineales bacterium]
MDVIDQLLVAILPGMLVAVVASIITVRLSLRQFYSERWWERKATAYTEIIESLFRMKTYIESLRDAEERGRELPEEAKQELRIQAAEGKERIFRAAAIGAFTISEDAADSLNRLRSELERELPEGSFFDQLENHADLLSRYLQKLRSIAKSDLKIE